MHPKQTIMYTFRIFNPEHEIALACNLAHFTAPKAGRVLRADMGYLPVFWAEECDSIVVDNVEHSRQALDVFLNDYDWWLNGICSCSVKGTLTVGQLSQSDPQPAMVDPWGWDLAVCQRLRKQGVALSSLPSTERLQRIRELAHRRTSARLLGLLSMPGTTGSAFECQTIGEVEALACHYGRIVVKAPWSSSGRGVRFLSDIRMLTPQQKGWIIHTLEQQQSIMVEPYYNKVRDFAMEFTISPDGKAVYEGLSLFCTDKTTYSGNLLASEDTKRKMISNYISVELLDNIQEQICSCLPEILGNDYQGPLGVDMMVVEDEQGRRLVHPCVEINLRRTMGHVALALSPRCGEETAWMQIVYDKHYELKITKQKYYND